jgi:hypothetical protein
MQTELPNQRHAHGRTLGFVPMITGVDPVMANVDHSIMDYSHALRTSCCPSRAKANQVVAAWVDFEPITL